MYIFALTCGSIKRKCVRMIQPVSAFSPRAGFRGSNKSYNRLASKPSTEVAIINAAGTSLAAGGLTTAIARSYTSSWSHAGVLGLCGAFLAAFFITPRLVENTSLAKPLKNAEATKETSKAAALMKETIKPTRRLVQFRQQA